MPPLTPDARYVVVRGRLWRAANPNLPEERRQLFEKLVAELYESGKAINRTTNFSLDEVIDPADTRKWVVNLLASIRPPPPRDKKKRPMIDTW